MGESGKKDEENVEAECQRGRVFAVTTVTAKHPPGISFKVMLL